MSRPTLEVRDLQVAVRGGDRPQTPVDGVTLHVTEGEALGLVGESGSGKTLTLRAILGVLPSNASIVGGEVVLDGEVIRSSQTNRRSSTGSRVAMVFQEPMRALNPLMRVETLIGDACRAGGYARRSAVRDRVLSLLREVGVPAPEERLRAYPHQLSGGLRQRVMIAMALATEPRVLLCDEPTTALDVTVQQTILRLLDDLRERHRIALVYVTHDLAVVPQVCDRVAVMYAGRLVEEGPVRDVFSAARHPYTHLLLQSIPRPEVRTERLLTIPGVMPGPHDVSDACRFSPRCPMSSIECQEPGRSVMVDVGAGRQTACGRHSLMDSMLERIES